MRIEQRPVYIAFNGEEFKTEKECIAYEESNLLQDIMPAFITAQKICRNHEHCEGCIFYDTSTDSCIFTGGIPSGWHI